MEDEVACNLIAHSIGTVMRQSLDDNFKNECKRLLGATNTNMVEEILFQKLMEIARNGSTNSTKQPLLPEISPPGNPMNTTSSATLNEPLLVEKVPVTNTEILHNIPISEMYRRTIQHQKRSLSPQPNGTESRFKPQTKTQNSAPF